MVCSIIIGTLLLKRDDTIAWYYVWQAYITTLERDVRPFVENTALRFNSIHGFVERKTAPKEGKPGSVKLVFAVAWPKANVRLQEKIASDVNTFIDELLARYPDQVLFTETGGPNAEYDAGACAFKASKKYAQYLFQTPLRFSVVRWVEDDISGGGRSEVSRVGDLVSEPLIKSPTPSQISRK